MIPFHSWPPVSLCQQDGERQGVESMCNFIKTRVSLITTRCFNNLTTAVEVGKYFTYMSGDFDCGFGPVYSVMDDFGNLVPVEV